MRYLYLLLLLTITLRANAQDDRMDKIRTRLNQVAASDTAFLAEVDFSVGNLPLGELIRNIAKVNQLNISVKNANNLTVNINLSRIRIVDLLEFLCRDYNLDMDAVGNIVSLYPHIIPPPLPPEPKIEYRKDSMLLSYDLINVPLNEVAKRIAAASGVNTVVPPALFTKRVSGYVVSMPVESALATLAESNDLDYYKNTQGVGSFAAQLPGNGDGGGSGLPARRRDFAKNQLDVDSLGMISAQIDQANIYDVLRSLCDKLGLNYYFISPVNAQTSLYLQEVGLNTLLKVLFTGTPYTWYEEEGIFMFGAVADTKLYATQVIQLQYRTVTRLLEAIPSSLKSSVQAQVFPDLNSIIVSGDRREVARVEQFIKSVDRTVPLIMIDVIIVETGKNISHEAGISVGVGDGPAQNSGTLSPGIGMNLNSSGINKLINVFNGFGSMNLGPVSANFYADIKFLEENGTIKIQHTPKLSTLNGHEAILKSGETKYYKEVSSNFVGVQNPIATNSYTWKSIDANMTIKIVPFVSGNDEITLSIEIEQREFLPIKTTKSDEDAPPGTSVRSFASEIRVQSEDMVLLGGIERSERVKSTRGLPYIARVPVLKWIFGKTEDKDLLSKLNIFIKPTVIH